MQKLCVEPGHFYSPIVDANLLAGLGDVYWQKQLISTSSAIDFYPVGQAYILKLMKDFGCDYKYAAIQSTGDSHEYYTNNGQFGWLDAFALFCLLRIIRPSRIVEIGSGFSTLLMADVSKRFLAEIPEILCIEPYPKAFLLDLGEVTLIEKLIQETSLKPFEDLGAGDILFVDSSHVCKTASDLHYILFEILPILKSGVIVHFHDVFLPAEYPKQWVIEENRSWNEQYFIRLMLTFSKSFRVMFSSSFASANLSELVTEAAGPEIAAYGGGSLYLLKV
jgi:hypothetical protein